MGKLIQTPKEASEHLSGAAMPSIMEDAQSLLLGKKVIMAGYLLEEDGEAIPCLQLEDGTLILAGQDDEFNGPGSLHIQEEGGGSTILCQTSGK